MMLITACLAVRSLLELYREKHIPNIILFSEGTNLLVSQPV